MRKEKNPLLDCNGYSHVSQNIKKNKLFAVFNQTNEKILTVNKKSKQKLKGHGN